MHTSSEARSANDQQCGILAEALTIYDERYETRGDLWRQADQPEDLIMHMRNKSLRATHIMRVLESGDLKPEAVDDHRAEAEDSLLDLINYAAFGLRWLRGN